MKKIDEICKKIQCSPLFISLAINKDKGKPFLTLLLSEGITHPCTPLKRGFRLALCGGIVRRKNEEYKSKS